MNLVRIDRTCKLGLSCIYHSSWGHERVCSLLSTSRRFRVVHTVSHAVSCRNDLAGFLIATLPFILVTTGLAVIVVVVRSFFVVRRSLFRETAACFDPRLHVIPCANIETQPTKGKCRCMNGCSSFWKLSSPWWFTFNLFGDHPEYSIYVFIDQQNVSYNYVYPSAE